MKGCLQIFRMIRTGFLRIFCQPWFWLASAGIGLMDALILFGQEYVYSIVLEDGIRNWSLVNILSVFLEGHSILWYAVLCLSAFPVVAGYIEDVKNNREASLFTRTSCFSYAVAQSLTVLLGAALCLFLGDVLFLLGEELLIGQEITADPQRDTDILLKAGNAAGYLFFWELQRCMRIAFYALLTFLASLWVKEKQFLTILPMIYCYLFIYFIVPRKYDSILNWITPRLIYHYNYFYPDTIMFDNCILQALYAVGYTIMAALLIAVILWRVLLRRRRA